MLPEDPNQPSSGAPETPAQPAMPTPNPAPAMATPLPLDPMAQVAPAAGPTPFRVHRLGMDHKTRLLIMATVGSLLVILLLVFSSFVLIAYGKIKVGSPKFRAGVEQFIVGLPFMPKTTGFVLGRSLVAQRSVKKFALDMSLAATNKSFTELLGGSNELDIAVVGPIDARDLKKPEMALNVKVTKQLDLDITLKKQIAYFKLNKFPSVIAIMLSSFGFPDSLQKKFVNQWFYYDTSTMETEASKNLAAEKKDEKLLDRQITDNLTNVMLDYKDKIKTTLTSEKVDSVDTYKITTVLTKDVIDALEKASYVQSDTNYKQFKPTISQSIPQATVTYWIDKEHYYIRKVSSSFTVKEPKTGASFTQALIPGLPKKSLAMGPTQPKSGKTRTTLGAKTTTKISEEPKTALAQVDTLPFLPQPDQEIPVSFVMKFDHINEPQTITAPEHAVKFEEYVQKVIEDAQGSQSGGAFSTMYKQSNDTKRRSDINAILNSVNQYMADNKGVMPQGISTTKKMISKDGADICAQLVPVYIADLPTDPNVNTGTPIERSGCNNSYFTGYTIQLDAATQRITVAAPYAELGSSISVTR